MKIIAPTPPKQKLEKDEANYLLLFTENPALMLIYDEETLAFLDVNEAAISHYGWSREEFLGMTVLDIRPPANREAARKVIQRNVGARGKAIGPFQHWRKDGTLMDMEITVSSILFDGRPGRLCLIHDITELKKPSELCWTPKRNRSRN